MKKVLLNALFMALATLGFAQPKFTETTVNEIHQAFVADPPKTVAERTLPTFTLVGSDGQVTEYAVFKTWNVAGAGLAEWPTSDVKVQQSGNFAIAKGITKHKPKSAKVAFHQRFVETYEFQNGQWMMASAHYTDITAPKADEEAAIKKLLFDERNAFFAGDKEKMTKFWTINPRTFVNASYSNGRHFYMNSERVQKAIADFKPSDQAIGTITDSKVYVYGNNAVANLELTANYKNGSVAKEHDLVLLEKEAGTWKVSGYSAHGIAADKQEDSSAIVKVIEKETQSWHDRNADGRIACIANVPYALMLVYHGVMESTNGVAYVTNEKTNVPEMVKAQTEGMGKPNGATFKNENYVVTVKGGTATAYFEEITTAADGKKTYGHGVRNLEKIDGLWKLTYIGGVIYKRD